MGLGLVGLVLVGRPPAGAIQSLVETNLLSIFKSSEEKAQINHKQLSFSLHYWLIFWNLQMSEYGDVPYRASRLATHIFGMPSFFLRDRYSSIHYLPHLVLL